MSVGKDYKLTPQQREELEAKARATLSQDAENNAATSDAVALVVLILFVIGVLSAASAYLQ